MCLPGVNGDQGGPFCFQVAFDLKIQFQRKDPVMLSAQNSSAKRLLQNCSFSGKTLVLLLELHCISLLTLRAIPNASFLWQVFLQCKWITLCSSVAGNWKAEKQN